MILVALLALNLTTPPTSLPMRGQLGPTEASPPRSSGTPASASAERSKAARSAPRTLRKRTVRITDDTGVVDLHVSGGIPTSVTFPRELKADQLFLADNDRRFYDAQVMGTTAVLVPKADLRASESVALQVALEDGTLLPFRLTSSPLDADLTVTVELDPRNPRVKPEPAAVLKSSLAELQGRLDECQSTGAEQGVARVAALVLAQDPAKPEAFTVERHAARQLDKQSRLLVQTKTVYRLFDVSYLVLTLENRDPTHPWVLDHVEVATSGGTNSTETRVLTVSQDLTVVPPGETSRLVVAFSTPALETNQPFSIRLLEKGGGRHVSLDGLRL